MHHCAQPRTKLESYKKIKYLLSLLVILFTP